MININDIVKQKHRFKIRLQNLWMSRSLQVVEQSILQGTDCIKLCKYHFNKFSVNSVVNTVVNAVLDAVVNTAVDAAVNTLVNTVFGAAVDAAVNTTVDAAVNTAVHTDSMVY